MVISIEINDSSCISGIAYDRDNRELTVRFIRGEIYSYSDVSFQTANDFASAKSKGRFFMEHISGNFESQKAS